MSAANGKFIAVAVAVRVAVGVCVTVGLRVADTRAVGMAVGVRVVKAVAVGWVAVRRVSSMAASAAAVAVRALSFFLSATTAILSKKIIARTTRARAALPAQRNRFRFSSIEKRPVQRIFYWFRKISVIVQHVVILIDANHIRKWNETYQNLLITVTPASLNSPMRSSTASDSSSVTVRLTNRPGSSRPARIISSIGG